eukprot:TRINITY_DN898_c0_g1_i2.p1 TRINITY_DN898_c0_g1~~TRINITY_DN898_c0_g1_i2.p1  ORF type:complete len:149 (-),score=22.62 TRINITY_DN898_c0_g1_i2:431-877(-)
MGVRSGIVFLVQAVVCLFCLTDGVCRLTPQWSEPLYSSQDTTFRQLVAPVWQRDILDGIGVHNVDAGIMKLVVGWVEVVSAVLLFSPFKRIAGVALALVLAALAYAEMRNDRPQYLQQCGLACGSVVVCAAGSGRPRPPARKPANKQK